MPYRIVIIHYKKDLPGAFSSRLDFREPVVAVNWYWRRKNPPRLPVECRQVVLAGAEEP